MVWATFWAIFLANSTVHPGRRHRSSDSVFFFTLKMKNGFEKWATIRKKRWVLRFDVDIKITGGQSVDTK
jgi:hypothetical protein